MSDVDVEMDIVSAPRKRRVAPFVAAGLSVVLGVFIWILASADGGRQETADTPLLGRPAPASVGHYADGTPFNLSRRKGSWVVLNFFRHDCVPCVREHPELIRFVEQQRSLGLEGAEFYSIVQGSTVEQVDEFFEQRGGDWPIVYDDGEFLIDFGVVQVPETWVIDPDGIIQLRAISEIEADVLSVNLQRLRELRG